MSRNYYQFAYVTTDIEQAMAHLAREEGIGGYMEMHESEFAITADTSAVANFALAFKGDLQFEIIQPLRGAIDFYKAVLPDTGYAMRFHHLGQHFEDRTEFDARVAAARAKWPIVAGAELLGGAYAYADARNDIGHYLEYFCFPEKSHLADVPRY